MREPFTGYKEVFRGTPDSYVAFNTQGERIAIRPVAATLAERDKRYGGFINNASIAQRLKFVLRSTERWGGLSYDKREALEMIASKIGRMLSGDPEYVDNWHDIAGYATLVEQRLTQETK